MLTLDRSAAVFLYCVLRQAERSVDMGVHQEWQQVRQYFQDERVERLRRIAAELGLVGGRPESGDHARRRQQIEARHGSGCWTQLWWELSRALRRRRRTCTFSADEVAFITETLDEMLSLLDAEQPDHSAILWLRRDLGNCEQVIVYRCGTVPLKCLDVENLGQPPLRTHYTIEELVPDPGSLRTQA